MAFVGLLSMVGFLVFLVLLVVNLIRKKSKKISAIGLPICFVLFIVAIMLTPEETPLANNPGERGNPPTQTDVATDNPNTEYVISEGDYYDAVRRISADPELTLIVNNTTGAKSLVVTVFTDEDSPISNVERFIDYSFDIADAFSELDTEFDKFTSNFKVKDYDGSIFFHIVFTRENNGFVMSDLLPQILIDLSDEIYVEAIRINQAKIHERGMSNNQSLDNTIPEPEPVEVEYTFGDTFIFDGHEITFLDEIEWLIVSDARIIFRIPISIKNNQDRRITSSSWRDIHHQSSNGTENRVGNSAIHQFDFTTDWELNFPKYDVGQIYFVDAEETTRKYMHFRYDGEGDYTVELVGRGRDVDNVEIKLPIPEAPTRATHTPTPPPRGVNAETYGHLRTGMTISQARTIMGIEPSSESSSTMEILGTRTHTTILIWTATNPLRSITVIFSGRSEFSQEATSISQTNLGS
jgi:hypothetical protein